MNEKSRRFLESEALAVVSFWAWLLDDSLFFSKAYVSPMISFNYHRNLLNEKGAVDAAANS